MPKVQAGMKVAHVLGDLVHGGAELLAVRMSEALLDMGGEPSIIVLGSAQEALVERVRSREIPIHVLGLGVRSPSLPFRLRAVLASLAPGVVHAHLFPPLYACALARVPGRMDARWIYTEHSTFNRRRQKSGLRPVERWIYGRYDVVTCVSEGTRQALAQWLPGLRMVLVENGVELGKFASAVPVARESLGVDQRSTLIVSVGALRPEKNHVALLDALALLPRDYALVMAGDGPERSRLEARVAELNLGERVRLIGDCGFVPELMAAADVFVLPSHAEAFGLSAVEAAASGLPVVFADVPGLADLFTGFGIPADPRDPASIADAVRRAVDPAVRGELVGKGRRLSERYSMERMMRGYLDVYAG